MLIFGGNIVWKSESTNEDYIKEMNEKLEELFDRIRDKKVIIGFTGGLGSFVLAKLAQRVCSDFQCVFIDTNYISPNDRRFVEKFMETNEIGSNIHIIVRPDLSKDILILNSEDREFFCKKSIVKLLEEFREKVDFDLILDGTTLEIYDLFWKGRNQFNENGKYSMIYGDLNINRSDLSMIAEKNELKINRYPETSLLSRFAYNIPISSELINFVAKIEEEIMNIAKLPMVRLRIIDNSHVSIETEKKYISNLMDEEVRNIIYSKINEFGFNSIGIDIAGYRSQNIYRDKEKII
jgi:uncharacterized protein